MFQEIDQCFSSWLKTPPSFTTFRVNTLTTTSEEVIEALGKNLEQVVEEQTRFGVKSEYPSVCQHDQIPELVIVCNRSKSRIVSHIFETEVIVDAFCGTAVLRGAHVFAPGVLGISKGASVGEKVSIYVNLGKKCNKGWTQKLRSDEKYFVGNGILLMNRNQLFGKDAQRGIAVRVLDNASGTPPLSEDFSIDGKALKQNLPSVVCSRVLDPKAGQAVLDMCAAPGNKTSHLSSLMNNEGIIIALDRSASRIAKLREHCFTFGVKNVNAFVFDSVKAVKNNSFDSEKYLQNSVVEVKNGPPFPPNSFDCILLDAPCSGSGQRPQLIPMDLKQSASFPSLQKKLFESAVKLLKPGGRLVYSTCSILYDENEGIVHWALNCFSNLKLIPAIPQFACTVAENPVPALLTSKEWSYVQKFGPNSNFANAKVCEEDTIGFFIAHFMKV